MSALETIPKKEPTMTISLGTVHSRDGIKGRCTTRGRASVEEACLRATQVFTRPLPLELYLFFDTVSPFAPLQYSAIAPPKKMTRWGFSGCLIHRPTQPAFAPPSKD